MRRRWRIRLLPRSVREWAVAIAIFGILLGLPRYQFARDDRIAGVWVTIPRGGRHCISLTWVTRQFRGQVRHDQVELTLFDNYPNYWAGVGYKYTGPPHVAAGLCIWPPMYWHAMFHYSLATSNLWKIQ